MSLDLEAIAARAAAATPGPWDYFPDKCHLPGSHGARATTGPSEAVFYGGGAIALTGPSSDVASMRDAEFIAHAREDIPALLSALRELENTIADLGIECDALRGGTAETVEEARAERDAALAFVRKVERYWRPRIPTPTEKVYAEEARALLAPPVRDEVKRG